MKILRLALKNLASLEGVHCVDFTREPLRSAGLFSICGPTGAGKSTLLDALCVALYERTPRLELARPSERLPDAGDTITQKDPRNLLRRGAGEGFAEVVFIGTDRQTYTARWSIRRAHGRGAGALQQSDMALFRGEVPVGGTGPTEAGGKKSEVLPAIAAKVGLSYEQFTRAVLLAQNDFATFLKANDHERAGILQALTGTQRFEQISIAVYQRGLAERDAVTQLERDLSGNAPMDAEERTAAEATLAEAEAARNSAAQRVEARTAQMAWFRRVADVHAEQTRSEAALSGARVTRESAEPRREELRLVEEVQTSARGLRDDERRLEEETRKAAESLTLQRTANEQAQHALAKARQAHEEVARELALARAKWEATQPAIREARNLEAALKPLEQQAARAAEDRAAAEKHTGELRRDREALRLARVTLEQAQAKNAAELDALCAIAPLVSDATAWVDRLDRGAAVLVQEEKATRELASARHLESAHATRSDEAARATAKAREACAEATAKLQTAEEHARQFDAEGITAARRAAQEALDALETLRANLQERERIAGELRAADEELAGLQEANRKEAEQRQLAQAKLPLATAAEERARAKFELARLTIDEATAALRDALIEGAPCPVCGAESHPFAAHPPPKVAAHLEALRAARESAKSAYIALTNELSGLARTLEARTSQIEAHRKTRDALVAAKTSAEAVAHSHPGAAAILQMPASEQAAALAAAREEQAAARAEADAAERRRASAEKELATLRRTFEQQRQASAVTEEMVRALAVEAAGLRARREAAERALAAAEAAVAQSRVELQPLWQALPAIAERWRTEHDTARTAFLDEVKAFRAAEQLATELQVKLSENATRAEALDAGLQREEANLAARLAAEAAARAKCDEVRRALRQLVGERAADELETELVAVVNRLGEQADTLGKAIADADRHAASARTALTTAAETREKVAAQFESARARLQSWLDALHRRTHRLLDRVALDLLLQRDEQWITGERDALKALDAAVQTAEGTLAAHRKALEDHQSTRPTPEPEEEVAAALAEAQARLRESELHRQNAHAVIFSDNQRREAAAALTRDIETRRLKAQPWEKLSALIGSSDGAKFRNIAQRRTLDILLGYANRQLDLLASRYRLQRLPESLNLLVNDRDMGDERRSVHSLSGGESFLVSLALALGLASLTSNRLRIESLFIDEGFGSLDPQTLGVAMGALMRLEAQGRKVGVISHVSEMAEAIPVQIRVEKGRSGAARLTGDGVVAIEAAQPVEPRPASDYALRLRQALQEAHAAGEERVSTRALRERLGCSPVEFTAARESLAGELIVEGRSLRLASIALANL